MANSKTLDPTPVFEKSMFSSDLAQLTKHSIQAFLQYKRHHTGRAMTLDELLTNDNVKLVQRTPFDDPTFLFIHDRCLSRMPPDHKYRDNGVPWTVHYLLGLLSDLKSLELPKHFQPGLILLYFKFCHGFEIPPTPIL